jgi:co-chaperonin GroES (HSP10)
MPSLAELIEPMPGRLAVQVDVRDDWTKGGLYIPVETARTLHEQRPVKGTIVALPEGYDDEEDDDDDLPRHRFQIGNIVLFSKYSGTEISYSPDRTKPKEKVIILAERDILARLRDPEELANLTIKG